MAKLVKSERKLLFSVLKKLRFNSSSAEFFVNTSQAVSVYSKYLARKDFVLFYNGSHHILEFSRIPKTLSKAKTKANNSALASGSSSNVAISDKDVIALEQANIVSNTRLKTSVFNQKQAKPPKKVISFSLDQPAIDSINALSSIDSCSVSNVLRLAVHHYLDFRASPG